MDFLLNIMFWIILAIIFGVAELVIPGAVLIFLAASGLLVAVCIAMGLVETWIGVLSLWFVSSLVMLIALRGLVTRFAPGDVSFSNTDEILADIGQIVEVVKTIGPGENIGRVSFRDISWNAVSDGSEIGKGEKVKIVSRDNITLVVEPVGAEDMIDLESKP